MNQFNVKFTATGPNNYSEEEQKEIRRNHHYLSAAWIGWAAKNLTTPVIGEAISTIPASLVDPVKEICMYHSKLSIDDCPEEFRGSRLRLVLALLRLADELDVDNKRVTFETVKVFSRDPAEGLYWWLHSRTEIVYMSNHEIYVVIDLHSEDKEEVGSIVQELFITDFKKKNTRVLEVLMHNQIHLIFVESESRVTSQGRDRLPKDIVKAICALKSEPSTLLQPSPKVSARTQASTSIRPCLGFRVSISLGHDQT